MISKSLVLLSLGFLAAAVPQSAAPAPAPAGGGTSTTISQCNTGTLSCCNSIQSPNSSAVSSLLGPLGIVLQGVTATVGLGCLPISVIGASGTDCAQQPACCSGNTINSLVSLDCTPVSLGL